MTSLLHFEDKVHHKGLAQAESLPLLMPRLLSQVEMERSPVPDISPPSPPPPASATALADTPGPSYRAQHSPEYVHVSTSELEGVMDDVCSLASLQTSMDQRLTQAETTLEQCHTMLRQIMSHLGLPHVPAH